VRWYTSMARAQLMTKESKTTRADARVRRFLARLRATAPPTTCGHTTLYGQGVGTQVERAAEDDKVLPLIRVMAP
jgi:hypothetical protein